jgi:hypothetical protein
MDMSEGPELTFEYSPMLVEGSDSDGETMLRYYTSPMEEMEMEYEYPEDDNDNYDGFCNDNANIEEYNTNSEDDCSDRDCISYPSKRRQRREKLNNLHCYVAHTGAVAVVASASMMAEGAAAVNTGSASRSIVAANAAILACVLGGVVAVLSNLLSGLSKAIRTPSQRREGEEDAPLRVCWLKSFCGLFCFASLVRFGIGSFADTVNAVSTTSGHWLLSDTSAEDNLYRVISVIVLSLISGCFLGLRHPLQSALLCGL